MLWAQTSGLKIIVIVMAGIIAQVILSRASRALLNSVLSQQISSTRSEADRKKRVETINQVVIKTTGVVIFLIVLLMVFIELGINVTPILTGAGIIGIAIGFGAQDMVKNLFHGIFILAEDQYSEGDIITVAGVTGTVEEFDLRRTVLRDLDGVQHHIPNGEIAIASNKTKGWSGIHLDLGIAYDTNLDKLQEVIDRVGQELGQIHPEIIDAPKLAGIEEFADSAMVVKILGKTKPGTQWEITREFRQRLKQAFDQAGIEIPFPHQVEIQKPG